MRWPITSTIVVATIVFCICGSVSIRGSNSGLFVSTVAAQEIGFLEEFALAENRENVLQQLVPGTEDYYFYHCLHYQHTQQLNKVEDLLEPWIKRFGYSAQVNQIRNRQALLKHSDDPAATLQFLQQQLNLNFNHQREIPQTQRDLPTKLDPDQFATEKLTISAMERYQNSAGFTDTGLPLLATSKHNNVQLRHLLQRLRYPDFPNVVDLIVRDLKERDSQPFGRMEIHKALTLKQLDELAKKFPKVAEQSGFIDIYLGKLSPREDVNWLADRQAHQKYLDRLWAFVKDLAPAHNSLKANILFRKLDLDRTEGEYNRERFLAYLKLPRNVTYINPVLVRDLPQRNQIADLNQNFIAQTELAPILDDQPLVREYLHEFLKAASDTREFQPYIESKYLEREFATVKILNGLGDVERWASLLEPAQYQQLMERIDLDFVATNPADFQPNDEVVLELFTKNIKTLIVKIFEINTENYYRKNGAEIDTNINLDGLVPNFEQTFQYSDAPALRIKREFKLPQLEKRGVYVVDFIAGGKSSRALIRKGRLQITNRTTAAGQLFSVIDEGAAVVTDANLWISGRRYSAGEGGKILVPFSTQPGSENAIISQGDFSCLQSFDHVAEKYRLNAAMFVDRESLSRSNKAKILLRPMLRIVNGEAVPLTLLKEAKLVITSVNLDGISATKTIADLKLSESTETVCEFMVPPRLKSLTLNFSAKIENISRNETETLTANQHFSINEIDQTGAIQDLHLAPTQAGYIIEIRGKTGEPRAKQPVRVSLKMLRFNDPVVVDLQSDEQGNVELGQLNEVESVAANLVNGSTKSWMLANHGHSYPQVINSEANEDVVVPAPVGLNQLDRSRVSLFEKRRGAFVADWFNAISLDGRLLKLKQLKPGDYLLRFTGLNQGQQHNIEIRVTAGKPAANAFVGEHRILENRHRDPLTIQSIKMDDDTITIKLTNANPQTRVHLFTDRYQPAFRAADIFAEIRDIEPWIYEPAIRKSVYMEGRQIGDEYQYILDRKYAAKYPGNMLARPSLLLNPWATQTTDNSSQNAADGSEFDEAGMGGDGRAKRKQAADSQSAGNSDFANLDFLNGQSAVLSNLKPDADGIISLKRAQLGPGQHIRVVANNAFSTVQQILNLPLPPLVPRDGRLTNALDPEHHFSQRKQIQILKPEEKLVIADVISAKFQTYDDLTDVYRLLLTLNPNTHLNKFDFILSWGDLADEKKRELYSEFVCHELNFFLLKKDPSFFESVVIKHLTNKRDKTFLDRWLLGDNLDGYVDPWRYARLNTVERILLSQRLENQSADITRNVSELYLLAPTPRSRFDVLYDASIRGLSLDDELSVRFKSGSGRALPSLLGVNAYADDNSGRELAESSSPLGAEWMARGVMAPPSAPAPGGGMGGGGMGGIDVEMQADSFESSDRMAEGFGFLEAIKKSELRRSLGRQSKLQDLGQSIAGKSSGALLSESEPRLGQSLDRLERRTRQVPVTRYRMESREKTLADGTKESYTVKVPFTEMITQNYSVPAQDSDSLFGDFAVDQLLDLRFQSRNLYRRLPPTQQWMENNYYQLLPENQTTGLVTVNRFWRDYANHDGGTFLSPYFPEAHRTFTEMMFVLAVLDLPLKSPEQKMDYAENQLTFTATGPTIVFHQQVESAIVERGNTTILVSENFFQFDDRYRFEDGVQFDKFISNEFHAHTLYGGQVVITNPTSTPRAVELLIQIPAGSVATNNSQETKTIQLDLEAFSTKTFEYSFYFPTAGSFSHYPAHVSADEKVLAIADSVSFVVTDQPAEVDKTSWAYVSQNGSPDAVIEFLNQQNILRLDLEKIAFRMNDRDFFTRTIKTLRNRLVYNHTVWSYSVKHDDRQSLQEFLVHEDRISQNCGPFFESDLLPLNPVERNWYQHREYWPLVNARSHQLGPQRKILNPNFFQQYQALLSVLAHRRTLSNDDHLTVTYYMLLQDRIEMALSQFELTNANSLSNKIQYDYCDAYLDLYREKPDLAAEKAKVWAEYPVDYWRKRFQSILAQVEEIRGGTNATVDKKDQSQKQTELAASSQSFEFKIEAGTIKVNTQQITELTVNFYEMDIELLFSRSPFAQDELDGFSMIRPNATKRVTVQSSERGIGSVNLKLPGEMQNKNVLVEIVAGDQAKSEPYFANSINVQLMENYGQLQVTGQETDQPISKIYVKVYARMSDGSEQFHKDGYTDLRGRFDYVSQSNHGLDGIQEFSVLILSEANGAVVRQAKPPQE